MTITCINILTLACCVVCSTRKTKEMNEIRSDEALMKMKVMKRKKGYKYIFIYVEVHQVVDVMLC